MSACPKCDGFLVPDDEGEGRKCVNCGRRVTAIEAQRVVLQRSAEGPRMTEQEDRMGPRCRKKVTSGSCKHAASEGSEFCEAHADGSRALTVAATRKGRATVVVESPAVESPVVGGLSHTPALSAIDRLIDSLTTTRRVLAAIEEEPR